MSGNAGVPPVPGPTGALLPGGGARPQNTPECQEQRSQLLPVRCARQEAAQETGEVRLHQLRLQQRVRLVPEETSNSVVALVLGQTHSDILTISHVLVTEVSVRLNLFLLSSSLCLPFQHTFRQQRHF